MRYLLLFAGILLFAVAVFPLSAQDSDVASGVGGISVLSSHFEPQIVSGSDPVLVTVQTGSRLPLLRAISCKGPSPCSCVVSASATSASATDFSCDIFPPASGSYSVIASNAAGESGNFEIRLVPGQKALLVRLVVPPRVGGFLFYAGIFVSFSFLLYGLHHIYRLFEQERNRGVALRQRRQSLYDEKELLKAAFMRGHVPAEAFRHSSMRIERELTEANARLAEFEKAQAEREKKERK
ncbi:MAG: hypothetical protein V1708_04245 [Candidatus Micrarchaeota archaeon]